MAGSTFHTFSQRQTTSAAHMNNNFDWLEQTILPQVNGTVVDNTYDFGSNAFKWRNLYTNNLRLLGKSWASLSGTFTDGIETNSGQVRVSSQGALGSTSNVGSGRQIGVGTVSTPDIRDEACTAVTTTSAGGLATGTTITSVTITTKGGKVLVIGHATVNAAPNGSGVVDVSCSIDRAGTSIGGGAQNSGWTIVTSFVALAHIFSIHGIDAPSAGSNTYNLRYTINTGSFTSVSLYGLTAVEITK